MQKYTVVELLEQCGEYQFSSIWLFRFNEHQFNLKENVMKIYDKTELLNPTRTKFSEMIFVVNNYDLTIRIKKCTLITKEKYDDFKQFLPSLNNI